MANDVAMPGWLEDDVQKAFEDGQVRAFRNGVDDAILQMLAEAGPTAPCSKKVIESAALLEMCMNGAPAQMVRRVPWPKCQFAVWCRSWALWFIDNPASAAHLADAGRLVNAAAGVGRKVRNG